MREVWLNKTRNYTDKQVNILLHSARVNSSLTTQAPLFACHKLAITRTHNNKSTDILTLLWMKARLFATANVLLLKLCDVVESRPGDLVCCPEGLLALTSPVFWTFRGPFLIITCAAYESVSERRGLTWPRGVYRISPLPCSNYSIYFLSNNPRLDPFSFLVSSV